MIASPLAQLLAPAHVDEREQKEDDRYSDVDQV
jgi:hypothetical protein